MSALLLALALLGADRSGRIIQTGLPASGAVVTAPIITASVEASTAGSGAPNVLTCAAESGKTITNEGSAATAYNTLPAAAAGCLFQFIDNDASDALRITAAGDDTIRMGAFVSAAAGYWQSGPGGTSSTTCKAVNATEWICDHEEGAWSVDGTTTFAYGGGSYSTTTAFTVTNITGVDVGDVGSTIGTPLFNGVTGYLPVFKQVVTRFDHVTATYTGGASFTVSYSNMVDVFVTASESIANTSLFNSTDDETGVYTHNDSATVTTTPLTSLTGFGFVLRDGGTEVTAAGGSVGTATVAVYFDLVSE